MICTFKRFTAICNHRSSGFSLRVIASVEVPYTSSVSTRDATSYAPDFRFLFLIWLHAKHLSCFKSSLDIFLILILAPSRSGYYYCTTSFSKAWTQIMCSLKSCLQICDGENLWQWSRLETRLNAPRQLTIPQNQFISLATVVECHWKPYHQVSSWLYLLIFTSSVKSRLRSLCHITLLFLRDSGQACSTFSQTEWKFSYNASLYAFHVFAQIFIVSISAAVLEMQEPLEIFPFPFI